MSAGDLLSLLLLPITAMLRFIEKFLFMLVNWYDRYLYSPLQQALWPLVMVMPRTVSIDGRTITIFTANIVSWSRTLLVIPIAFTLKYQFHWSGFWLVLFHDFLDHLDGIVAKVQKQKYGSVDDPIVGGFMDAFCDKIVNVLALWSILMVTDFSQMTWFQTNLYVSACAVIIAYEFTLGVVRVQDFFRAYYLRKFKQLDSSSNKAGTEAVMEGKLKEKLESIGVATLCVSQASAIPMGSIAGILGVTSLYLSVRLAHSSLMIKLRARSALIRSDAHASDDEDERKLQKETSDESRELPKVSKLIDLKCDSKDIHTKPDSPSVESERNSCPKLAIENSELDSKACTEVISSHLHRCFSMPGTAIYNDMLLDSRAERVYTIGCFDLFHHGHVTLLRKMRTFGKKVIVGIHDSRSIYHLKHRVPIDSTVTRMRNVKQFADEVFCVAGTDPTPFIDAIFDRDNTGSAIYIRGDDMPNFPARNLCEKLMTVKFLPYTEGVSSTKIRKDLFNSSHCDIRLDDSLFY